GRPIIFDKNYVTVDAGKNKITFKTSKYSEDMEITEVLTIIGNDSTSHLNETYPYDPSSITKSSFKQTFYRYRDTVYGEWYTVIHKKRKLFVELKENNTGKSRKLAVFVGAGNDHGGVYMTQKTKK
ncbi:MAG: hypothetical protein LBU57_09020, partial [Dysgonamonadaceae bacterium]|nr:hypothetical protein [Dysgonamonadaceae bacterium]